MIDMGFELQVGGVLDSMLSSKLKPENEDDELDKNKIYRTTYVFSATMSPAVEGLARKYNSLIVSLLACYLMKENDKPGRLKKLLDEIGDKITIVFVNKKKVVALIYPDVAHVTSYNMPGNVEA
ncbi:Hypothetical predicted protein [Olea europaea subsp. europaea]|uniref:Uncharacterized protein n=1 Tax=Olea europaea subsp. europaea TaxID=158383 RepID=A0A8S0SWW0_OLEEU|nr:Hypothetical predicted protein [Olea europaea subsp. europaea]